MQLLLEEDFGGHAELAEEAELTRVQSDAPEDADAELAEDFALLALQVEWTLLALDAARPLSEAPSEAEKDEPPLGRLFENEPIERLRASFFCS